MIHPQSLPSRPPTTSGTGRRHSVGLVVLLLIGALALAGCDGNGAMESGDDTPPQVVRVEATSNTQIAVVFDEPLDPASVTPQAFTVSGGIGVPTAVQYVDVVRSATLDLAAPMQDGNYSVTVTGVRDAAGNALTTAQTDFTFNAALLPGGGGPAIGAAYPNVGDSRIILINKAGTRFVYWTPSSGAFSDAEAIGALENGALPLSDVGATSSTRDDDEDTYFFSEDGTTFTVYERATSAFDEVEEFGEDGGTFGDPEIETVGAAVDVSSTQLLLFNRNGTRYGVWNEANERWDGYFNFPADFFGGGAPISAVGAIVFVAEENAFYLFDRDGTKYTVFSGNFSNAFAVTELGDGTLSFD